MEYSCFRLMLLAVFFFPAFVECRTRHYKFNVVMKNTSRLCSSKPIVTVNGMFPGPTLYAREDDTVLEVVVVLAEWWKSDTEAVVNEALKSGLAPNVSDAHTINGHPGAVPACSSQGGFTLAVQSGKTYMLRLINAALNEELFFKIAGHKLTVVEVDATYVKPFQTDTVLIAPGQTTNVLVTTNKNTGKYLVAASPFMDAPIAVDNITATATLHYSGTLSNSPTTLTIPPPKNATAVANQFANSLRSLNSKTFPAKVPLTVDHSLLFTVGLGINPCPACKAGNGSRVVASINNVTFVMPTTALLQAHFFNISGVFTTDFPANPPQAFNYTGSTPPTNLQTTRVWFMHCHLEVHTTWGLKMAFLVDNGKGPNESTLPPPSDLPKC
ncbi:hypothetical protein OIU85_000870 [Salix viminalis]|uniref:laccase n=1 Tax=Salix viminalis TaxID=40686 RepID=A0A9Q0VL51_SALVM|nr:hypothetical protein OIU85_000870 [Salix viminalis]